MSDVTLSEDDPDRPADFGSNIHYLANVPYSHPSLSYADALLCRFATTPPFRPGYIDGHCTDCRCAVQWSPQAPKRVDRVCWDCGRARIMPRPGKSNEPCTVLQF